MGGIAWNWAHFPLDHASPFPDHGFMQRALLNPSATLATSQVLAVPALKTPVAVVIIISRDHPAGPV